MNPEELRKRLKAQQDTNTRLRAERGAAVKRRDQAQQDWAKSSNPDDHKSAAFVAAKDATQAVEALDDQLREGEQAERDILAMLAQRDPDAFADPSGKLPTTLPSAADLGGDYGRGVKALAATPGAVLATMLERRKRDVHTLPEHVRNTPMTPQAAALIEPLTTEHAGTYVEGDAIIDLLAPQTVALASGINVMRIDGTETRVPRFTDLPVAEWIPELGAFPKNGPGIERVTIRPPKVGLITELSIEVFEDLTPLMLAMLQVQLFRAVAVAFDAGVFFGDGEDDTPLGVANTDGIQVVDGIELDSLGGFAQALARLIGVNARPGALLMNPIDLGELLMLTEGEPLGANSNVPLWKGPITGPTGLRLPYFETPIWLSPGCPVGNALAYDPGTIIAVLRREADIAIDPFYGFDNGEVGLRTYLRGDVVVGQPDGAVHIRFGTDMTAEADTDVITAEDRRVNDGDRVKFSGLTGGAPLVDGATYYVRDATGDTFKVAASYGGPAINITTDATAGRVRKVA